MACLNSHEPALNRQKRHLKGALLALISLLTACGGGGGGGDNAPPPVVTPPPQSPGTLAINVNTADVLPDSLVFAQTVLRVGRSTIDAVVPFASLRGSSTESCFAEGSRTVTLLDNDTNNVVSAGDELTILYTGCRDRFLRNPIRGTVNLTLTAFELSPSALTVEANVTFAPDVEIVDNGLNRVVGLSGEFTVRLVHGEFLQGEPETLTVSGSGAQSFEITGGTSIEAVSDFQITRRYGIQLVTPNSTSAEVTLAFLMDYQSDALGGSALCEATRLEFSGPTVEPRAASVTCSGANGSSARVTSSSTFEVDPQGGGSFSALGAPTWSTIFDFFLTESGAFNLRELVPDLPAYALMISAVDIAEDPTRERFLLLTGATDTAAPNSILAFDPVTQTQTQIATLPQGPRQLVVSDDGAYYYVTFEESGSPVLRYDAATGALSAEIDFSTDFATRDSVFVDDIDVSPVDSLTIALVLKTTQSSSLVDAIVIDDMTARPSSLLDAGNILFARLLSDVLFTSDGQRLLFATNVLTAAELDANGVGSLTETNVFGGVLRRIGSGEVLAGNRVLNEQSLVQRGRYSEVSQALTLDETRFLVLGSDELLIDSVDRFLPQGVYALTPPFGVILSAIALVGDTVVVIAEDRILVYSLTDAAQQDNNVCSRSMVQAEQGAMLERINCFATDIAYDAQRDRLYIALRELRQSEFGNSIGIVDPDPTGSIEYVPIGDSPRQLALSSGGDDLFVAFDDDNRIATLNLISQAISRAEIPLAIPTNQMRLSPREVINVAASTIVPSGLAFTFTMNSGAFDGIAYFQDDRLGQNVVARTDLPPPANFGDLSIEFDSTGELLGLKTGSDIIVQRFSADGTGVALTSTSQVSGFNELPLAFDRIGDDLFEADGDVIDTLTGDVSRRYDLTLALPFATGVAVLADVEADSVYFLINNDETSTVARYELVSGTFVGALTFESENISSAAYPSRIIKMGPDRIGVFVSLFGGIAVIDVANF